MFQTLDDVRAVLGDLPGPDMGAKAAAEARNAQLTKPAGALARMEELAIWYASWRGTDRPQIVRPQIAIFTGNHGVAAKGVSAFPPEVTAQMVLNFEAGGAAINQLAKAAGATLTVHALEDLAPTADFTEAPAMDEATLCRCLSAGWAAVDTEADLFAAGEMGIGNTTSAAAVAAALFGGDVDGWVGRGTGVDDEGFARKSAAVQAGLTRHAKTVSSGDALTILGALGGHELAGMAGAILRARALCIPVVLDGFIATAAAAVLAKAVTGGLDHAVAGHVSAEGAHAKLLDLLGKSPILTLGLRLGEGSGAATAIPVLKSAVACHSGMATFAEAGVADGA
ncbi:MAG: nicotinate-nucleotide--dimethylbenzimidazole phosphoribosyltransferase [Pseudomonadota bacterium]